MARKLCTVCTIRTPGSGGGDDAESARSLRMCNPCYTEGGWENSHDDNAHDAITAEIEDKGGTEELTKQALATLAEMSNCWICHPELNLATAIKRTGHTNTVAKSRTSHDGHNHLRTPYDRGLCRKSMRAGHGPYDANNPKV